VLSAMIALSARSQRALLLASDDTTSIVAHSFAEHVRQSVPSLRAGAPPAPLIGCCPPTARSDTEPLETLAASCPPPTPSSPTPE
jgi:hypothetical protein